MTNKSLCSLGAIVATAATVVLSSVVPAQAASFNFSFDDSFDDTLTPPIVGTGTFSFDGNLGDGTYALTSLTNYLFSFNFGSATFGNNDISTPVSEVLITILNSGNRVIFSNIYPYPNGSGPHRGAIDFDNSSGDYLTFEPPYLRPFFPPTLYGSNLYTGTYLGIVSSSPTPVPTPALLPGLIGMSVAAFRRRSQEAGAED
jgi:hypothetical protein